MVSREPAPPLPDRVVAVPIQVGEALSSEVETTRRWMNRATAGVMGVTSRTVTQSNWVSKESTLSSSTLALSAAQLSLSAETSGKYCRPSDAALVRRLNFIA